MNLEDATASQLEARLKELKTKELQAENDSRHEAHEWLTQNVDKLLEVTPNHGRTSCSDANPCNSTSDPSSHLHRCTRCQLLKIQREEYNDEFAAIVTLEYQPIRYVE